MAQDRKIDIGADGSKRVLISGSNQVVKNETSKSIRKIMEVVELYTNYNALEDPQKAIVRDTILNNINKLARVISHKQTMVFK